MAKYRFQLDYAAYMKSHTEGNGGVYDLQTKLMANGAISERSVPLTEAEWNVEQGEDPINIRTVEVGDDDPAPTHDRFTVVKV